MTLLPGNKLTLLAFLLSIVTIVVSGQIDTNRTDKSGPGKEDSSEIKKHSLYVTSGFGSNMIFLGSSISHDNPFYSTGLVYGFRNSFYLSASTTHIQATNPFFAYFSAAAYYKHTFNSWLDISAEFSGYKPTQSLEQNLFNEFIFANFTTGLDWKLLYTRFSGGALFSGATSGFFQVANSRYFQTREFFKEKSYISFNPEINFLMGEIVTIETVPGIRKLSYSPPFMKIRKDPPQPAVRYSSRFGPMNFEFSLPVTFNYSKLSIEADPCYILPAFSRSSPQVPRGFTFYMTASFRIF